MISVTQPIEEEPAGILTEPITPEGEALRRKFCTMAALWRDCQEPACGRARSCRGDPAQCFARGWNGYSHLARVWVECGYTALEQGLSARAAVRAADEGLLTYVKLSERLALPPRGRRRWPK